jgi:hypothetical protein
MEVRSVCLGQSRSPLTRFCHGIWDRDHGNIARWWAIPRWVSEHLSFQSASIVFQKLRCITSNVRYSAYRCRSIRFPSSSPTPRATENRSDLADLAPSSAGRFQKRLNRNRRRRRQRPAPPAPTISPDSRPSPRISLPARPEASHGWPRLAGGGSRNGGFQAGTAWRRPAARGAADQRVICGVHPRSTRAANSWRRLPWQLRAWPRIHVSASDPRAGVGQGPQAWRPPGAAAARMVVDDDAVREHVKVLCIPLTPRSASSRMRCSLWPFVDSSRTIARAGRMRSRTADALRSWRP